MFIDNLLTDRQAEAGPPLLGGMEGGEDMFELFGAHPPASVANFNLHHRR